MMVQGTCLEPLRVQQQLLLSNIQKQYICTHSLNLAVVKSLQSTNIRNMTDIVGKVYFFFNAHPKRQRKLEDSITEINPSSQIHKLNDLCRTLWVQHIDSFSFFSLFESTIVCLQNIHHDGLQLWSKESVTDAHALQQAISNPEFIARFVITHSCLQYLHSVTELARKFSRYCTCSE